LQLLVLEDPIPLMKLNIGDITAKIPGESKKGIRKYVQVWVFRTQLKKNWRRIVQILRQRRRKMTNTAPTTPCAIQAASQSTFINAQL
jgi:hypothetical protein